MRERVLQIAAHMLEASADDLDLEGGVVSVRGTPSAQKTLAEVAHLAYMTPKELPQGVPPGLEIASRFTTDGPTWSNAAHICTFESDRRTGLVTPFLRYIVSEDCGALISPPTWSGPDRREWCGHQRVLPRTCPTTRQQPDQPRPSSTAASRRHDGPALGAMPTPAASAPPQWVSTVGEGGLGRRQLGGYPTATLPAPWRGPGRLLVALRLQTWGVQLRRLP
jgi:hypothetical protein